LSNPYNPFTITTTTTTIEANYILVMKDKPNVWAVFTVNDYGYIRLHESSPTVEP